MTPRTAGGFITALVLGAVLVLPFTAPAGNGGPEQPSREDKCPVCGMFVYKYPDWLARMVFADGSAVFFDGAKDMFKAYFDTGRYVRGKARRDIRALFVREYYDMRFVDARTAFFVEGSDVYGPMGHELIPLATREDAEAFTADHRGRRVLTFREVTPAVLGGLD